MVFTIQLSLHLLRGSRHLAALMNAMGLPRFTQSGFGESLGATMFANTKLSRTPENAKFTRLVYIKCRRNGTSLLHSGICRDAETIHAIFSFLDSGCQTQVSKAQPNATPIHANVRPVNSGYQRPVFKLQPNAKLEPDTQKRAELDMEEGIGENKEADTSSVAASELDMSEPVSLLDTEEFMDAAELAIVQSLLRSYGIDVERVNNQLLVARERKTEAREIWQSHRSFPSSNS